MIGFLNHNQLSSFIVCLISIGCIALPLSSDGQIISRFTWDSNPVTAADVGPNAISVSTSATSSAGGVGATNGLNAGLPKQDINLVLASSPIFDVAGIEISFDFQRDESQGTFFSRGNSLIIDGTAQLSVSYRVDDGAGGFTTVSSGNAYAIPNDNTFRNYRFYYLPVTGYGSLRVDGVEVWSNDGPDNRNLYWTGAGNINIGTAMDGSGSNQTFFDNFIIAEVSANPLPITLSRFDVSVIDNNQVKIDWETLSEINNDFFTIERSVDIKNWSELVKVPGAGNSTIKKSYTVMDDEPLSGYSYYRLKQTDYNGDFTYSNIESARIDMEDSFIKLFPNPVNSHLVLEGKEIKYEFIKILRMDGVEQPFQIIDANESRLMLDVSGLSPGIYILRSEFSYRRLVKR